MLTDVLWGVLWDVSNGVNGHCNDTRAISKSIRFDGSNN
jgi:hypothetical protein